MTIEQAELLGLGALIVGPAVLLLLGLLWRDARDAREENTHGER